MNRAGSAGGICHYETKRLIASSPRPAGRRTYRDYPVASLRRIQQVRQAQQLGLSLAEIGPLLNVYGDTPPATDELLVFLRERLAMIQAKQTALAEVAHFIEDKIARFDPDTRQD